MEINMHGSQDILLVITNMPDAVQAESLAEVILANRLAACINIMPACLSLYHWEGELEKASEVPMLIKTTGGCYPALEATIKEQHPYDLPEIIALPLNSGLPEYLNWVATECTPLQACSP